MLGMYISYICYKIYNNIHLCIINCAGFVSEKKLRSVKPRRCVKLEVSGNSSAVRPELFVVLLNAIKYKIIDYK
jgi:hypothetical protein